MFNDVLNYFDQNKIQFQLQSNVYSCFLNIMKNYKIQTIEISTFIERILRLFADYFKLIQKFKTILSIEHDINSNLI